MTGLTFGQAIEQMKQGKKLTRRGWNGKGMYVYLVDGRRIPVDTWVDRTGAQAPTEEERQNGYVEILPHIDMYTVNREGRRARLCGWLASQTDMISDDWEVVE